MRPDQNKSHRGWRHKHFSVEREWASSKRRVAGKAIVRLELDSYEEVACWLWEGWCEDSDEIN